MSNIYADNAPRYIEAGYSPLPIMPGGKAPGYTGGGYSRGLSSWADLCSIQPSAAQFSAWSRDTVSAGIGLALGYRGVVAIDLDYGDGEIREIIESLLPGPEFRKVGRNGYTEFYQCSGMKSRKITLPIGEEKNGRPGLMSVCEILADGKQTVIPPTIHPNTGRPYEWVDDPLSMIKPEDLPEIHIDFAQQVIDALDAAGYRRQHSTGKSEYRGNAEDANPVWAELKERALMNLDAWVPSLNGSPERLRDRRYRMAAHRRGGSNKTSVGISNGGIRDWADDDDTGGMTAIDLVMAANSVSEIEAFRWLDKFVWGQGVSRMNIERQNRLAREAHMEMVNGGYDPSYEAHVEAQAEAAEYTAGEAAPVDDSETGHWGVGEEGDYDAPAVGSGANDELLRNYIFASKTPDVRESTAEVFQDAQGMMGDLISYFTHSMRSPSLEVAGGTAIAIMTALFGRRWAIPFASKSFTYPNLYTAIIASSGYGKSTTMSMAVKLYRDMADIALEGVSVPEGMIDQSIEDPEKADAARAEAMAHITRVVRGALSEGRTLLARRHPRRTHPVSSAHGRRG